jgi:hypothetical protein
LLPEAKWTLPMPALPPRHATKNSPSRNKSIFWSLVSVSRGLPKPSERVLT